MLLSNSDDSGLSLFVNVEHMSGASLNYGQIIKTASEGNVVFGNRYEIKSEPYFFAGCNIIIGEVKCKKT